MSISTAQSMQPIHVLSCGSPVSHDERVRCERKEGAHSPYECGPKQEGDIELDEGRGDSVSHYEIEPGPSTSGRGLEKEERSANEARGSPASAPALAGT